MTRRRARLVLTAATMLALVVTEAPVTRAADPPSPPAGVTATSTDGQARVTWSPVAGAVGYNVYRDAIVPGPTSTFVGAGDIASCSSTGDEATALLLDAIPGTVFAIGDHVYENGTAAEFTNCYAPTWGRHKARTRPAVGNHEYHTTNAAPYYQYFGAAAGDPAKGYYSYDEGSWHVIVLNSVCWIVSCAAGSAQERWLRADLAANPKQCVVAYWHHPRFSSGADHGDDASVAPFWDALYDANADLILNGHDHMYERFAPQTPTGVADPQRGIRQFNVGTGGRSHYSVGTIKGNSQVRDATTYGVLRLTLRPGAYDWTFVPEAGRSFTDTGTGSCHDANGPVTRTGPRNGGTPIAGTAFTDANVTAGTEYHYVVTAVDSTGQESAPSAVATVTVAGGGGPATYALDTFGRTVVDGFGSTTPGGTYSLSGTAAD
ncbi:MAG TPA: metallophosphoesterase, partial [Candidatus Saccharimonadales bacterium]|nr:metallophosphoesterase [Candidatus Saccharimonadales bacterium]